MGVGYKIFFSYIQKTVLPERDLLRSKRTSPWELQEGSFIWKTVLNEDRTRCPKQAHVECMKSSSEAKRLKDRKAKEVILHWLQGWPQGVWEPSPLPALGVSCHLGRKGQEEGGRRLDEEAHLSHFLSLRFASKASDPRDCDAPKRAGKLGSSTLRTLSSQITGPKAVSS